MFIKLLIISAVLLGIALAGLAISILISPEGKFPETHISHNKEMKKRGITCAQRTDLGCTPIDNTSCCAGCDVTGD
jgi:hypothetical protein